jgi:hypothetical protein
MPAQNQTMSLLLTTFHLSMLGLESGEIFCWRHGRYWT